VYGVIFGWCGVDSVDERLGFGRGGFSGCTFVAVRLPVTLGCGVESAE
jgi:hypothetical protein